VTLFHKPSNTASTRVLTMLKQANAQAVSHATEDQASSHQAQNQTERMEFELDVTEAPPTADQLKTLLDYLGGPGAASKVIRGAQDESDAMRRLKADGDSFERPVVSLTRSVVYQKLTIISLAGRGLEPGEGRYVAALDISKIYAKHHSGWSQ